MIIRMALNFRDTARHTAIVIVQMIHPLNLRVVLLMHCGTSTISRSRSRCSRGLVDISSTLGGPGTVHAVVAQADSGIVQLQEREPRSCLQCDPVRCKVVPHTVVAELDLWHVADCLAAHSQVEGCLGDVGAEVDGMAVMLPVQADVREDERGARRGRTLPRTWSCAFAQIHLGSALVRLPPPLNVEPRILQTSLSFSSWACLNSAQSPPLLRSSPFKISPSSLHAQPV